jgi:thiamine transport system ATP-binding protein
VVSLDLQGVSVAFDGAVAVDAVDLSVEDGHVLAVLGPSGCGKSTLLRAVAGLEPLSSGRIGWDGVDLAGVPTHRRGFALMFQDGQLFDHLTVARNVGYSRRLQGASRRAVRAEVDDLLELVGLGGYADRLPRTLSGGERQRVALARSLAARPRLLLLDEPLSALDAGLRGRLAADLRQILTASGTTALLVTHDQDEAFAIADRLAVMRGGRIVQEGATGDVWACPADAGTALFLGYARVLAPAAASALLGRPSGAVALRPTALLAGPDSTDGFPATVVSFRPTPDAGRLVVALDGLGELDAVGVPGWVARPGQRVVARVAEHGIAVLPDAATEAAGTAP